MLKSRIIPCFTLVFLCLSINLCNALQKPSKDVQALQYFEEAKQLFENYHYDSALKLLDKASELFDAMANYQSKAKCYNLMAKCYFGNHAYDDALLMSNKVIHMSSDEINDDDVEVGIAWVELGRVYEFKSLPDSSIYAFNKAIPLLEDVPDYEIDLARAYGNMGTAYRHKLDFDKSLGYYRKSLIIKRRVLEPNDLKIVASIIAIAFLHVDAGQYELAIENLHLVLPILKQSSELAVNDLFIEVYSRLSESHILLGDFEKGVYYVEEAEKILDKRPSNFLDIMILRDMGNVFSDMGNYNIAMTYFNRAMALCFRFFGPKHPANVSVLYLIGKTHERMGNHGESLNMIHESLLANSPSFNDSSIFSNPHERDFFSVFLALRSLKDKGISLFKIYNSEMNIDYLKASHRTFTLCDSILIETRLTKRSLGDKIQLGRLSSSVYEGCINTCLALYKETGDMNYYEKAFIYSEKAKSGTLTEMLNEVSAKNNGQIPEDLLSLEDELKKERAKVQTKIAYAVDNKDSTQVIDQYRSALFDINFTSDSLTTFLEKNFPIYQQLKRDNDIIDVKEVQESIPDKSVLIEFYEGNKNIYVFSVSKETYQVRFFPRDSLYTEQIEVMSQYFDNYRMQSSDSNRFSSFMQMSKSLYDLLLKETLSGFSQTEQINELIIIPDGTLFNVPFEILISSDGGIASQGYKDLNYVINDFIVTYGYSATLSFDMQSETNFSTEYLGFAPEYADFDSTSIASLGKFRDEITALDWNQYEVEKTSEIADGDYYLAGEATESRFKTEASGYGILHMAMHTLINDEDPMDSKFVFTMGTDSVDDGFLHAFELYNMRFNANLAVLSACNTGSGQLKHGEGAMSLARGFRYAGVPNLVMSLWQVSDQPASDLMIYFYEGIERGENYSIALRNAKLRYLKESDKITSDPFYWASFVYIGESSSGRTASPFSYPIIIILVLGVVIVFFFYKKVRIT